MKRDLYTKAVLTVIAIMLSVIAINRLINPATTATAQSAAFAGVQSLGWLTFFDTRTGELWQYNTDVGMIHDPKTIDLKAKFRLSKLGQPVAVEFNGFVKK